MRNGLSNASRVERYIKHSGRRRTLPALILLALEILFFSFSLSFVSRGGARSKRIGVKRREENISGMSNISVYWRNGAEGGGTGRREKEQEEERRGRGKRTGGGGG